MMIKNVMLFIIKYKGLKFFEVYFLIIIIIKILIYFFKFVRTCTYVFAKNNLITL